MIIYTNRLEIVPGALQKAQGAVLKWLQRKYPAAGIEASDVAPSSRGVRKLGHNEYIDVVAEGGSNESPDLWLLRLVHPDRTVSGREWQTDVGLSRDLDGSRRFLSIVLRAEDKSPLVRVKIVPSRPGLVEDLVESGALDPATPGVGLRSIDSEDAARAFGYECADAARQHRARNHQPAPGGGPDAVGHLQRAGAAKPFLLAPLPARHRDNFTD